MHTANPMTTKSTAPIAVESIVRNSGYGAKLMIVIDIDEGTAVLRSYGTVYKGSFEPAKNHRIIKGKVEGDRVLVPGGQGDWIYQHVDTHFPTTGLMR